jgi:hypothetical protein
MSNWKCRILLPTTLLFLALHLLLSLGMIRSLFVALGCCCCCCCLCFGLRGAWRAWELKLLPWYVGLNLESLPEGC